jgi:hypothetical protein
MQRTRQQPAPLGGRIRRFFTGEYGPELGPENHEVISDGAPPPPRPPRPASSAGPLIDMRPISPPDLAMVYLKVQRLEAGVELVAETLKKAYGQLAGSIDALGERVGQPVEASDVRRSITDAMAPLDSAVGRLAETTEGFPLIVAAATDRLAERIDTARLEIEQNVLSLITRPWDGSLELDGAFAGMDQAVSALPTAVPEEDPPAVSPPEIRVVAPASRSFRVDRESGPTLPATPFDVEPVEQWAEPEPPDAEANSIWGAEQPN